MNLSFISKQAFSDMFGVFRDFATLILPKGTDRVLAPINMTAYITIFGLDSWQVAGKRMPTIF